MCIHYCVYNEGHQGSPYTNPSLGLLCITSFQPQPHLNKGVAPNLFQKRLDKNENIP